MWPLFPSPFLGRLSWTRASEPRPMGGADAPAPSLFTCPQLCHQGDLLSITIITAPCAGGLVRFGHFPVDRPTPRRTRPVLEAELLALRHGKFVLTDR